MAGYIENISLPIQTLSNAQASILEFLFPGFTRISTAVQGYLTVDLNAYVPLLYFLALLANVFTSSCGNCLRLIAVRTLSI